MPHSVLPIERCSWIRIVPSISDGFTSRRIVRMIGFAGCGRSGTAAAARQGNRVAARDRLRHPSHLKA